MTGNRPTVACRSRLLRHLAAILPLAIFVLVLAGPAPAAAATCTTRSWITIHAIQTDLPDSPCLGYTVTTTGIVTAVLSDGFYLENSNSTLNGFSENWDSDTCTSEGIFVYTPSGLPANAVLNNHLEVVGVVQKSNNSDRAGTQIYIASPVVGTNVSTLSTGNSLPSAISSSVITSAITNEGCSSYSANSFGQWLPFEGMRVNVPSSSTILVTQGTGGTVTPASQTATTNGQFWALITSTTRPTRATGIDVLDPAAASAPSTVTTWSGNPTLLLVDSTTLGGTALDASAGTKYTGSTELVGIVDYHVSTQGYTGLLLDSSSVSALSKQGGASPVAASDRDSTDQLTFATQELNSLTETETNRISKLANAIINYHKSPDILAVQGATPAALSLLQSAITSASGPRYTISTASTADSSGLVNAFFVNDAKFDGAPTTAQALASATYTTASSTTATLFERSPLVLTAKIKRRGISDYEMTLINASFYPRTDLASTTLSEEARIHQEQQAEQLTTQVLEPLETAGKHVMVMGGFDSFEFSDGYVDTMGIVDGAETASGTVWLYDSNYNSTVLENTTTTAKNLTAYAADSTATVNPVVDRYTYVESGSAEQPDHILITTEMAGLVAIDYARFGADFPVSLTYDTSTVERASNHDGLIAYFTVPYPTTTVVTTSGSPSYYDAAVTFTATVTVTGDTAGAAGTPDGAVTFYDTDGTTKLGTGTLSSGVATFTYSKLTVGTHTITASYGGSETGLGYQSSSGTVLQEVDKDVATLALNSSQNSSVLGQSVTFTATASSSGETPSGTVTFFDSGTQIGAGTLSSGTTSFTTSSLALGTHTITATYSGDTTNTAATAALTPSQVVNTNTTTAMVTSSLNPSYYGDNVTFTATFVGSYGAPTGTVTFVDASTSTTLGTATSAAASGTYTATAASAGISTLAVGSHTIQAIYATNGTNAAATGSVVQTVNTDSTTLTVTSLSPSIYYGKNVTFAVTASGASGTPKGSVSIYVDGVATYAGTLSSGAASIPTTTLLSVGVHSIVAHYGGGDGIHAAADSPAMSQTVLAVYSTVSTLTCTPLIAEIGTAVSCTDSLAATVGQPSGTITYYDGSTAQGTATVTAGTATFYLSALAVGSHTITATDAENDPYLASTSNAQTVVILSDFTLTATPASGTVYTGEALTSTITVAPGTGFTLDVALTCTGLPTNTTCTLTPTTVTGGSGTSKLVIQTTAPSKTTTAANRMPGGRGWPVLAGLLLLFIPKKWRRGGWLAGLLLVAALAAGSLTGCGGSSSLSGGTPAGTYTVTVTGTAVDGTVTLAKTATVTVKVQSLF
ncbi:MAG: Ig-like domain repeat protein [Terracidiphilus sp.]|nr:Ig-like domain repeat protein [Terracidiphilus sp.]